MFWIYQTVWMMWMIRIPFIHNREYLAEILWQNQCAGRELMARKMQYIHLDEPSLKTPGMRRVSTSAQSVLHIHQWRQHSLCAMESMLWNTDISGYGLILFQTDHVVRDPHVGSGPHLLEQIIYFEINHLKLIIWNVMKCLSKPKTVRREDKGIFSKI